MEDKMANLNLADEEEEAFQEEVTEVKEDFLFCLVGSCLTDSVVHFSSLRNTMANLWHPIGGSAITDLGIDVKNNGTPVWIFLGDFLVYDTKVPTLGMKWYMRLKVHIDLGHGERFYPMKERVDLSHIIFGWDIMLKALIRRGPMGVSQWLCESDGTRSQSLDKKGMVFCAILGICI
ncbi:hypothetical protein Golax_016775 [Gossypium laxum]|uniref:DUF4283 domain-containing protein n=1 Tax=Gossypium laxum TaxID=34288 RepID=A0A7J8YYC1_9ROSI|nr:hypothetical protein [Gossypium laxum]